MKKVRGAEKYQYDLTDIWNFTQQWQQSYLYREEIVEAANGGEMGVEEMSESGEKVQTSTYEMNKSWLCNMFHGR